ncbi:MAG: hypothetical protein LBQ01_10035 [Prevotellaceae bacterium]|nr:hypothetical protein [Prevotellaceae bacterium]
MYGNKKYVLLYSQDEFPEIKEPDRKKSPDFFDTLSAVEGELFRNYVTNSRK